MKLNLGCGLNKIEDYINIDVDASLEPDQVIDFRYGLPFETNSVSQVVMYHTIEHIEKKYHANLLSEIHRVLEPSGFFIVSYPEFLKCVDNWRNNLRGQKEFWENTIYGRQLSDSDYHVCIMDTDSFKIQLVRNGFEIVSTHSEPGQPFNTVLKSKKVELVTMESVLESVIWKDKVNG